MTDFFTEKVTIYNDIPQTEDTPRSLGRFVVGCCNIQGGTADKSDGTIRNAVNSKTVITKDIEHYKPPQEYLSLSETDRESCFTVQVGDFIVFGEADDTVANASEFAALQIKYKNFGMKVTAVDVSINGMAVDNITITSA